VFADVVDAHVWRKRIAFRSTVADVGRVRHLGLHADEVLDRVEGGQPPAQQKLPLQRRG
jgi:hypothetical protein